MKRVFAALLTLFIFAQSATAGGSPPEPVEVPIIMYHKVTRDRGQLGKHAITPGELAADLAFLADNDYQVVTMNQLIAFVLGDGGLPEQPIVLTFDDGYFSDYRYVFPLLKQYEIPIVSSIMGKITDTYTKEGRQDINYPHLTWPLIREMASSGLVEFQSHGYDLHRPGQGAKQRRGETDKAYATRLGADLNTLQARIEAELGTRPTTFTYPYGARSRTSDGILKSMGFSASLICEGRRNLVSRGNADCLFGMGRINRPHGRSLEEILAS